MSEAACAAADRLTQEQKSEIFAGFARQRGDEARARFITETAKRLGVSEADVRRAALDERQIRRRKEEAAPFSELAMAYLAENALDAARVLVEMMNREATTDQQLRMKQSAATELMNRLGMARERDEPRDARIVITGMEPGMPPAQRAAADGERKEKQEDTEEKGEDERDG